MYTYLDACMSTLNSLSESLLSNTHPLFYIYIMLLSMDPDHDPVEGMIGMEVLEQFDVDFDFPAGRLRLWKPHSVESVARRAGMTTIDALVVNETRLLGFRVVPSAATTATAAGTKGSSSNTGRVVAAQPFLGVVDCGVGG